MNRKHSQHAQQSKPSKTTVKIFAVMVFALIFTLAVAIGQHRKIRMLEYAQANSCNWQYSEYLDREPVCR